MSAVTVEWWGASVTADAPLATDCMESITVADATCVFCGATFTPRPGYESRTRQCASVECRRTYRRVRYARPDVKEKEKQQRQSLYQRRMAADPEGVKRKMKDKRLRSKYGITLVEYDAILSRQGGGCAICGSKQSGGRWSEQLHVDHCHDTGKVRGLLCETCNRGLGLFHDSPEKLRAAAAYLGGRT
jgi:hypothetical protein